MPRWKIIFSAVVTVLAVAVPEVEAAVKIPKKVQITDPRGDASYVGPPTQATYSAAGDILKVWFVNDVRSLTLHIQTAAPPPEEVALIYRVRATMPLDIFLDRHQRCFRFEARVPGSLSGPSADRGSAEIVDRCNETRWIPARLKVDELPDGTGLVSVVVDRRLSRVFADCSFLAEPKAKTFVQAGHHERLIDVTNKGSNYRIAAVEAAPNIDRLTRRGDLAIVTVAPSGSQASGPSYSPSLSANGRFVAFTSRAFNLLPRCARDFTDDIYVHDNRTGRTTALTRGNPDREEPDGGSCPVISANGRFVAFRWGYSTGDEYDDEWDLFVHDLNTGERRAIGARDLRGREVDLVGCPSISRDGRFVAFESPGRYVRRDPNHEADVYVHDAHSGRLSLVSAFPRDRQGDLDRDGYCCTNYHSVLPSISSDGRSVAFMSSVSPNPARPPRALTEHVYVRDLETTTISLVSVNSKGQPAKRGAQFPDVSASGRFVSFASIATNLPRGGDPRTPRLFVHDRKTATTTLVKTWINGTTLSVPVGDNDISADGGFVVFEGWNGNERGVYVFDRHRATTRRVDDPYRGIPGSSSAGTLSEDGAFVAFVSEKALFPSDGSSGLDVFVRRWQRPRT